MNDIVLLLDGRMAGALGGITADLASKSAFAPAQSSFHIRLLEAEAGDDVKQLCAAVRNVFCREAPCLLTGRLGRWVIHGTELRIIVEVIPTFESHEQRVLERLCSGRACRDAGGQRSILVGTVEQIDPSVHAAFLVAVEQAYPIVETSTFALTQAIVRQMNRGVLTPGPCIEINPAGPHSRGTTNTTPTSPKAGAPMKRADGASRRRQKAKPPSGATAIPFRATAPSPAQPMDLDSLIRARSRVTIQKKNKRRPGASGQARSTADRAPSGPAIPQPAPPALQNEWANKCPAALRPRGWNRMVRVTSRG